jgi:hypothetical protein
MTQAESIHDEARVLQGCERAADAGSWRTFGIEQHLSGTPGAHQEHHLLTAWTERCRTALGFQGVGRVQIGIRRWLPCVPFLRSEQGSLPEQSAHPVGAQFGGRMQPAEGAHAGKTARQDVLEKARQEVQRIQVNGGVPAGFAVAIRPSDFAVGQSLNDPVVGGGLEDVPGEVTQGFLTLTSNHTAGGTAF